MKKLAIIIGIFFMVSNSAFAVPYLQLDISDGIYDNATETVFSTTNPFTLYALIDSGNLLNFDRNDTFYVSAAITPKVETPENLGFFLFDGVRIDVTDDMTLGTPPADVFSNQDTLGSHGIYDTYFTEFSFFLDDDKKALEYNSENSPGGLVDDPTGSLFYEDFLVDVTGLSPEYSVHFDLYTKNSDGSVNKFAPFSHDAQSAVPGDPGNPVPEPATVFLMLSGILGLFVIRKRFSTKN